jgi:hypothetical protein
MPSQPKCASRTIPSPAGPVRTPTLIRAFRSSAGNQIIDVLIGPGYEVEFSRWCLSLPQPHATASPFSLRCCDILPQSRGCMFPVWVHSVICSGVMALAHFASLIRCLDGMTSGRYSLSVDLQSETFPGSPTDRKRKPSYTERDWLQRQGSLLSLHAAEEPWVHACTISKSAMPCKES